MSTEVKAHRFEKRANELPETESVIIKKAKKETDEKNQISNQTVYVKNIDNKLSRNIVLENLLALFITYGDVISINYPNKGKLRGQAWVTLSSAGDAAQAVRNLQGQQVLGKSISLEISPNKSDTIKRLENLL